MSFRIATAFVDVKADDSGLQADIAAKTKAAAEAVDATVKVTADTEAVPAEVKAAAEAAHAEAKVSVKVDESGAALAAGLAAAADGAAPEADKVGEQIGDNLVNGLTRDAQGKWRNALGQFATDAEKVSAGIPPVKMPIEIPKDDFEAQFRAAMEEGQQVSDAAARELRNSYGVVQQASSALRQTMEDVDDSTKKTGKTLEDAGNKAGNSKSGFDQLKSAADAVGTTLRVVGMISLAPSLGAIPAIAAGAAGGLLTLALGLGDVIKALRDAGQASGAMGQSGAQLALTAFNNSVAIRNAEQAITDAVRQAAQQQIDSAESVAGAQQSLGDAVRQSAIAQENSYDSIISAQQRAAQATISLAQDQRDLTQAQRDAVNTIADLKNANSDAALSQQAAQLALQQAIRDNTATQNNSLDTDLQKQQSSLAVAQAQQGVVDAQQRAKEAQEAATQATQEGVTGLPAVVTAQQKVTDAIQATADANHAVAIANRDAADQQISSSEAVGNAEQRLQDAQRQAAQQQITSDEQVAKAQQALLDLEEQQKLAAAAAAASSAGAANQFAKDYAKLTPAGKAFVDQVLSMRSAFHQLQDDAQSAMLPGFTQMLKDSNKLLPDVELGVERTGKAFGDTALAFGHLFANPSFDASATQFTELVTGGLGEVLSALPPLLSAIVTDGNKAAPLINSVATGIHDIVGTGLPAFLSGLSTDASGAAQGVSALFGAVDGLLGPIGTLAGAASGAVGPALATLEPEAIKFADTIEQDLLPLMPELSTDLVDVAQVADQLLQVLEPIIPVIAGDLSSALQTVDPLLRDTANFLHDNASWLTPVAEGVLGLIAMWKTYNAISSVTAKTTDLVTTALGKFGIGAKGAASEAEKAAESIGEGAGLGGALGTVIPIVGTVAVGAVALGTTLNHMLYQGNEAATGVDQFTEALLNSEATTDNATSKLDTYAQISQAIGSNTPGVTDSLAQTGLGMIKLANAVGFTTADLQNYDASLAELVTDGNADRAATVVAQLAQATGTHGQKLVDVNKDLPQYAAALEKSSVQSLASARSTQNNADATNNLGSAVQTTTDKFSYMTSTMSQSQALDQFQTQLLQLQQTLQQNGTSLDNNTTKGLANRQAFADAAQQIENYGQQLSTAGTNDGVVAIKMQDMIGQLETQAGKFGYNKQQVDAYLKSIGLIPSSVETTLTTDIAVSVNQTLLQAAAQNIGHVVGHYLVPGQAAGGLVTGPGSGTSDSVLRRLSNGEYVMTAQTVAQLGVPYLNALNYGTPYGGQVPQVGGTTPQAGAPTINLNYYGTQQPTVEQQQTMMRDLALAVRT